MPKAKRRNRNAPASAVQQMALLDFALSQSSAIFYIAETSGESPVSFIGANVEAITGHAPQSFLDQPNYGYSHIHPDDLAAYKAAVAQVTERRTLIHEYRFRDAGGTYRWFRDELRLIEGDDGEADNPKFIGCMVDISAEKDTEERVRESVEIFKSVLDASPIAMSMVRLRDQKILFENPAIHAVFREDPETSSDKAGSYDIDPAQRDLYLERLKTEGAVDNFPIRFRRDDGSEFVGAHSGRLIEYDGEQVVVTGMVDLTEQTRRETELELARETLEDAIESLSEGFVLYDADDRLVMCNSQYRAFHGEHADLLQPGAKWEDVTRERGRLGMFKEAESQFDDWLAGQLALRGRAHREVFPFQGDRWFEYSHRKTRQGGFVSVWRDVTEWVEMETALRTSEEHFRSIVEGHPVPVWMVDLETARILYESPAAAEMVGREWPSDTPAYTTDHVPDPEVRLRVNEHLREHGSLLDKEFELKRADGSTFWASVNDRLITYNGRDVSITSFVDLTERREQQAELARQRDRLHQNEKLSALGELLAGVSHELNNPLSVLVGQALMLQELAPDEGTAIRADRIAKAADRCARIVRTFLTMARQRPAAPVPIDLAELIDSALDVAAYSLRSLDVEVRTYGLRDLPPISGEPDQLVQVFTNLIVNAQHALQTVEGPRILRVRASHRPSSGEVVIKLKDNGPGVPEHIRSRVFEPLYTTKASDVGTGMGLALCHRIIEGHGGRIELEASYDKGASFIVRLPCATKGAVETAPDACEENKDGGCAILVVDDEPDVGGTLADVLGHDGHNVTVTSSASAALALIERERFDIVLSDVRMPEMDGPAFYRALRETAPGVLDGLAFITGDTLSPKVSAFLDGTGRPFIEKPIMPNDARELVASLLRAKREADCV